jgi:hypothetical protein
MDLLLRLTGWDFATAARRIEAHLGLPAAQAAAFQAPVPQKPASTARKAGRPARIPDTPPPDAPPPELGRASGQWCYTDAAGAPLFWVQRLDLLQGGRRARCSCSAPGWMGAGTSPPAAIRFAPTGRPPDRSTAGGAGASLLGAGADHRGGEGGRCRRGPVPRSRGGELVRRQPGHRQRGLEPPGWRAVSLWPDADASGREAMARLSALLLELGCPVAVVLPPSCTEEDWDLADAPGASGWDLADATWSPAEAQAYLEGHSRTVQLPEPEPAADADAADSDATDPANSGRARGRSPPSWSPRCC